VERNGNLPPGGRLTVTCGLTACTMRSAPCPTLGIEYGKPLPFLHVALRVEGTGEESQLEGPKPLPTGVRWKFPLVWVSVLNLASVKKTMMVIMIVDL